MLFDDDGCVEAVQLAREAEEVETEAEPEPEAPEDGRDGKAAADARGALTAGRAVQDEGPLFDTGAGPPSRVLFFSLSTRLECFWDGAALGTAGFAVAALAQPLELEVAPCMPLRPGKLG